MYSLGIELSTQAVKIVVLDPVSGQAAHTAALSYDAHLPSYGTASGVLPSNNPAQRGTSPFMLVEALELAFENLACSGINMGAIGAVKADCMQHCMVCGNAGLPRALASLAPGKTLVEQVGPAISRPTSPIWEDRTPVEEAALLTRALKDQGGMAHFTGNRTELRFPAAQTLKWQRDNPHEYEQTAHILVLSAFVTSLLLGRIAPVDTGDGWGTNLNHLDLERPGWSPAVLDAMENLMGAESGALRRKLGGMTHYDASLGKISPYFHARYGICPQAAVLAGTGDNPATLMGCGGRAVISLGSSYTVNGAAQQSGPSHDGAYNLFGYASGKAMALSVFTNGSKVHDLFMKQYVLHDARRPPAPEDWSRYVSLAGGPKLSPHEPLMLPYLAPESVPLRPGGIVRQGFDATGPAVNIRSLCLSQVLALKLHSSHLDGTPDVCVAGGGAGNLFMMQLLADIFNARVCNLERADFAAPLGCAISAARLLLGISPEEAARRYSREAPASARTPIQENIPVVETLLKRYQELEANP